MKTTFHCSCGSTDRARSCLQLAEPHPDGLAAALVTAENGCIATSLTGCCGLFAFIQFRCNSCGASAFMEIKGSTISWNSSQTAPQEDSSHG